MKQLFQLICCLGLLTVILTGCSNEPKPMLKVGLIQWVGYQPLLLARNLGFYDERRIKLVELPSSTDSLHLLQTGELDAAALTLDETLLAMSHNAPLSIVFIFDISNGGDTLIAQPSIKNLQELKGKRVGVESSAVGSIMLYAALQRAKLNKNDIRVVYLTADEHVSAYKNGKVDAVITFEPSKTTLLKQGGNELFTSRMLPSLIVDVLAVRTDQLQEQHANIQTLVNGYYKARHYMEIKEADAMQRMAPALSITPTELKLSFEGLKLPTLTDNQVLFAGNPSLFIKNAYTVLNMLKNAGILKHDLDLKSLQNNAFLDAVQP